MFVTEREDFVYVTSRGVVPSCNSAESLAA